MNAIKLEQDFCKEFDIPWLGISNPERLQNILAYRNDRKLYRRKCDSSGASIISCYSEKTEFPVYKSSIWWSDTWNATDYAFEADLNLSFFEQFHKLQSKVPREGSTVVNAENCEYNSHTRDSKNVYLSHLVAKCQDVLYSFWQVDNTDLVDCNYATKSSLCYDSIYINNCYNCVSLQDSNSCQDCHFSFQLNNCKNCILCCNQKNKEFYYLNKAVTKEQYKTIESKLFSDKNLYLKACEAFEKLRRTSILPEAHILSSENCTGDHIQNSKNCFDCFDIMNSEDCVNHCNGGGRRIFHGYSVGFPESDNCYSCVTLRACSNMFFSMNCWNSHDCWYCDNCVACQDCFACVGLKRKQYCFFNQQLSKAEYEKKCLEWKLKMRNDNQLGYFLPMKYSVYAYNQSTAIDFFPKNKQEILSAGLNYYEEPAKLFAKGENLLTCATCQGAYKLVPAEIKFYKKMSLANPWECPDCRLQNRLFQREAYKLSEKSCNKCNKTIITNRNNKIIYCLDCYRELIY